MLAGEPAAGPAEAAVDLVEDQDPALAVAQLAQAAQEPGGRDHETAATLDRLHDDRADGGVAPLRFLDDPGDPFERGALAAGLVRAAFGERRETDAGEELRLEGRPEVRARGHGERAEGEAVVGALEGNHATAARPERGGLEGGLDRFRAGAAEDGDAELAGRERGQAFEEAELGLGGVDVAERVGEGRGLTRDRGDHIRVGVAGEGDAEAGGQVDEGIAVDVAHGRAARLVPEDRALVADLCDVAGFDGAEAHGERAGCGARHFGDKTTGLITAEAPVGGHAASVATSGEQRGDGAERDTRDRGAAEQDGAAPQVSGPRVLRIDDRAAVSAKIAVRRRRVVHGVGRGFSAGLQRGVGATFGAGRLAVAPG